MAEGADLLLKPNRDGSKEAGLTAEALGAENMLTGGATLEEAAKMLLLKRFGVVKVGVTPAAVLGAASNGEGTLDAEPNIEGVLVADALWELPEPWPNNSPLGVGPNRDVVPGVGPKRDALVAGVDIGGMFENSELTGAVDDVAVGFIGAVVKPTGGVGNGIDDVVFRFLELESLVAASFRKVWMSV